MTGKARFTDISPERLAALLQDDASLFILDVREPFELAAFGAVPGVMNIPLKQLPGRLEELPRDPSSAIAVVCQTGNRSVDAARYLSKMGFTQVYNLAGGTFAWSIAGQPLQHAQGVRKAK
jgi:rhodanese-related sulfurtransferase